MAQFFRRLSNEHGDVPAALRFLTTHPGHEERVQAAERDAHRFRPSRRLPAPGALRCR
jgi:predicted Zn-dependent protease